MPLAATLLRPIARLAGLHASSQLRRFLRAHRKTRQVQEKLLEKLLAAHAETDFGRDHGLGTVRSYKDFTRALPVQTYDTLMPYVQRVLQGRTGALLPDGENPLMFSLTSGTTGEPKHIPVTRRFLADIRRGWNIFGMQVYRDHPEAWVRPILQLTSAMEETRSPTGKPCGAISGLLAAKQKKIVRRFYATPPAASQIDDPQAKYYTILRCAVGRDVAMITTANPSSTIKLIETGQSHAERLIRDVAEGTLSPPGRIDGQLTGKLRFKPNPALAKQLQAGIDADGVLLPRHFWNVSVLANWTGGTVGLYIPRLGELFGGAAIRDIGLLASEGRFSVPLSDATPAGVAEITGNFLEFVPAEGHPSASSEALRAHEVDVGAEYFLLVSNWAGLFRYNMDDRVRVVDRLGQSPVIEFLSRGRHTANITGEKITEHQVVEAMRRASQTTGQAVQRFVFQGRFAKTPHYQLRLEMQTTDDADRLAAVMDGALGQLNMEYRSKRASGRLGPIRPVLLASGQLEQAEAESIRRRRGRSEQYKHQYLLTEVLTDDHSSPSQPGQTA